MPDESFPDQHPEESPDGGMGTAREEWDTKLVTDPKINLLILNDELKVLWARAGQSRVDTNKRSRPSKQPNLKIKHHPQNRVQRLKY